MILMTSMHLLFNFKVEALFSNEAKSGMSVHLLSQRVWAKLSNSVSLSQKGKGKMKIRKNRVIPLDHGNDE